jgi:hypothetical protein
MPGVVRSVCSSFADTPRVAQRTAQSPFGILRWFLVGRDGEASEVALFTEVLARDDATTSHNVAQNTLNHNKLQVFLSILRHYRVLPNLRL